MLLPENQTHRTGHAQKESCLEKQLNFSMRLKKEDSPWIAIFTQLRLMVSYDLKITKVSTVHLINLTFGLRVSKSLWKREQLEKST